MIKHLFLFQSIFFIISPANAQLDGLLGKAGSLFNKGLSTKIQRAAITTSFDDCDKTAVMPPDFGKDSLKKLLCNQPFEAEKGYKLMPGFFTATVMSFCLHAGTRAPTKGDGYLYAPLKGPKDELVTKLINNWYNHKEVSQHDLQLILWAIIAKTKISQLSPQLKAVAVLLLSDNDIEELSKVGLDFVGNEAMKKLVANMPPAAQKLIEIENQMRQKFYQATVNYQEMENLAMLSGLSTETSSIVRGTWSKLPNGCYIKYLPNGYQRTTIVYYVPQSLVLENIYYFGPGTVAMPANTGAQRLAQSNKIECSAGLTND